MKGTIKKIIKANLFSYGAWTFLKSSTVTLNMQCQREGKGVCFKYLELHQDFGGLYSSFLSV